MQWKKCERVLTCGSTVAGPWTDSAGRCRCLGSAGTLAQAVTTGCHVTMGCRVTTDAAGVAAAVKDAGKVAAKDAGT